MRVVCEDTTSRMVTCCVVGDAAESPALFCRTRTAFCDEDAAGAERRDGAAAAIVSESSPRPSVSATVCARLGVAQHIADNVRVFGVALDAGDLVVIEPVLAKSRDLMHLIGDCGAEYR